MQIRRFEAGTMVEAVRKVKEEFGPDALVLSSRSLRKDRGLFGLFSKPIIEITAAVDRGLRRDRAGIAPAAVAQRDLESAAVFDPAPLEAELRALRGEIARMRERGREQQELCDELQLLRSTLTNVSRESPRAKRGLAKTLVAQGLAGRHVTAIAAEAEELSREQGLDLDQAIERTLAQRLEARLQVPRMGEGERGNLVVGAPGVGKTTTLAKLVARCEERGDEAALISADSFRIGAEEPLRTYANLLDVRFAVAVGARDIEREVRKPGTRRIYVDTAGRGPADAEALGELLELRRALGARARVDVVVEATTKESDMRQQIRRYAPLRPDGLIVSKVDEASGLENVVNLLLDGDCPPLLWLTDGQRVPEDLSVPEPGLLSAPLLGRAA